MEMGKLSSRVSKCAGVGSTLLVFAIAIATQRASAQTIAETPFKAFEANQNNSGVDSATATPGNDGAGNNALRIGYVTTANGDSSNGNGGFNALYYFALPVLGAGQSFTSAHFAASLVRTDVNQTNPFVITPRFSVDVYAVGFVNSVQAASFNNPVNASGSYFYTGSTVPLRAGETPKGLDTSTSPGTLAAPQLLQHNFFPLGGINENGYTTDLYGDEGYVNNNGSVPPYTGSIYPDAHTPGIGTLPGGSKPVSGYTNAPNDDPGAPGYSGDGNTYLINGLAIGQAPGALIKGTDNSADAALLSYLNDVIYPDLGASYAGGDYLVLRLNPDTAANQANFDSNRTQLAAFGRSRYQLGTSNAEGIAPTLTLGVPEPASFGILAVGLSALACRRRR